MAKILIAEDDTIIQKLVSLNVEKMGHIAFISPNGKHAYEALKANPEFEILITDIMMPEMNGEDLIKTLRGNSAFQGLPIIIMSAIVGYKDIKNLLELGATRFQPKPINMPQLKKNIEECMLEKKLSAKKEAKGK